MTLIKDPLTGQGARVDSAGNLRTHAVAETQESDAAHNGDCFIASTVQGGLRTLTLAAGNDYALMYLKNLSQTDLLTLMKTGIGASAAGLVIWFQKNPVEGVLANNTEVTPINRNFSSGKVASAEAHIWDEVGTAGITGLTGGEEFAAIYAPVGGVFIPLDGSIHLGAQNSVLIGVENPTGGAVEVVLNSRFIFEPLDDLT